MLQKTSQDFNLKKKEDGKRGEERITKLKVLPQKFKFALSLQCHIFTKHRGNLKSSNRKRNSTRPSEKMSFS